VTQPVPEEDNQTLGLDHSPPDEHGSDLPDEADARDPAAQEENAGSALDQPSDGSGGE
jgi:hypothetical protein